ncbi:YhcH/YjgK/YiaL family protein [Paenibacillus macerans]|nr:YhcH/YjgK/YiaL family protein [Paenibacillus macerans]GBK67233.1 YhcH/YjgK/YiaL family protein [Paenibacillus macerans]GIP12871.1 hypothetical protein J1TS5_50410 [Paenibacillus macerans]
MMAGDIRRFERDKQVYPAAVRRGLEHLFTGRLSALPAGRYELEGERMYALVQEYVTRPAASLSFESHETYVDIQFIVSGEERIGWTMDGGRLNMIEDRLPGEDIRFYEAAAAGCVSELLLGPGQFAVFFPSELHRPCGYIHEESPVRKIVIKIHLEQFR